MHFVYRICTEFPVYSHHNAEFFFVRERHTNFSLPRYSLGCSAVRDGSTPGDRRRLTSTPSGRQRICFKDIVCDMGFGSQLCIRFAFLSSCISNHLSFLCSVTCTLFRCNEICKVVIWNYPLAWVSSCKKERSHHGYTELKGY